tara:strand:- start:39 stop:302 length:264 start_codon:yes stop_codon:yes gene_type:complete
MKTVKFDLVLKVHNDLKEDELKSSLELYLINDEVMHSIVSKVIGEHDAPENFFIHSIELKKKGKASKNTVQSSKKSGIREKEWNVAL